jgi:hypothetical protein
MMIAIMTIGMVTAMVALRWRAHSFLVQAKYTIIATRMMMNRAG